MKIFEAMNSFASDGSIFKYLPMYGNSTPQQMGVTYVLQHSGKKIASSFVQTYTDDYGRLTEEGKKLIGDVLTKIYKDKWDKLWDAINIEYDPIENYNRIEEGSDTTTNEDSVLFTRGQETTTNDYGTKTTTDESSVQGFNSNNYNPDRKNITTLNANMDLVEVSGREDSTNVSKNESKTHSLRTHGNIGVTTSQQMLESEISLRAYNFFDAMFNDIDSYCALKCYYDGDFEDKIATTPSGGNASNINISLTQLDNGVKIDVLEDNVVTDSATVYNGTDGEDGKTPVFKLEKGNLYYSYDEEV